MPSTRTVWSLKMNAFEKVNAKYDEKWLVNKKDCIENEASLLELALNVHDLYEGWVNFGDKNIVKPILLWIYCKNRVSKSF